VTASADQWKTEETAVGTGLERSMLGSKKRLTVENALAALNRDGADYLKVLRHGSLHVEIYRPQGEDPQTAHTLDEIYVVISGAGAFICGEKKQPIEPGEVLFVPAGTEHKFAEFSDDFATWVFFFGPEGGEHDSWLPH
jgi:mannose-6-phosphate isomerase-like protein (cupin superfamily)